MSEADVALLRRAGTIRERSHNVLQATRAGASPHYTLAEDRLGALADEVVRVTLRRYPTLDIPYHSRWRHFEAGGIDRVARWLDHPVRHFPGTTDIAQRARSRIDLAVVSVLLDAGAGAQWSYREAQTGLVLTRSEGLGVAAFRMFEQGSFSGDPDDPFRVDAEGLARLTPQMLAEGFQVGTANPLVGTAGRLQLLQRLGKALAAEPRFFGAQARPGGLYDALTDRGARASIEASDILAALLEGMQSIWPSGSRYGEVPIGDAWPEPLAGGSGPTAGWLPLHKLSQWLTYSLLEPFEQAQVRVGGLDTLTALAEYRNGGLLIDGGVIAPRDPSLFTRALTPASSEVVQWRALTVALVDALAPMVRERLHRSASQMPLARILEGGTWATGRELAQIRRNGLPPLTGLVSDGTVF